MREEALADKESQDHHTRLRRDGFGVFIFAPFRRLLDISEGIIGKNTASLSAEDLVAPSGYLPPVVWLQMVSAEG